MGFRAWSRGLDTTEANGVAYGSDFEGTGRCLTDSADRVFLICDLPVNTHLRLDPPSYDEWFTMTPAANSNVFPEVQMCGDDLIYIPMSGVGAMRYHPALDTGFADHPDGGGPAWDHVNDMDLSTPTWDAIIDGFDETNNQFFATARDPNTGRIFSVGRRIDGDTGYAIGAQHFGYLDPDGIHWVRAADLPGLPGDPSDLNIQGHKAICDSTGIVYVAGGSGTDPIDLFRSYTPGTNVAAPTVEKQRIEVGLTPPWTVNYGYSRDAFQGGIGVTINDTDNLAAVQAACDAYFGADVVVATGAVEDHVLTWADPGAQGVMVSWAGSDIFTFTVTQHGGGYPSDDTWTELATLPDPRVIPCLAVDSTDRIYCIGGLDDYAGTPVSTAWRYDPGDDAWTALDPIPSDFTPASALTGNDSYRDAIVHNNKIYVKVSKLVSDLDEQMRDHAFSPGAYQVSSTNADPTEVHAGPTLNPQPTNVEIPTSRTDDILVDVTIAFAVTNVGGNVEGTTDAPTFNVLTTDVLRGDDDISVYSDATVRAVPAGHFSAATLQYQIAFTDTIPFDYDCDTGNALTYKYTLTTNAPGTTYRIYGTRLSATYHIPTGAGYQTRMAVFDIDAETWELTPPCVFAHESGGFARIGHTFYMLCGTDS